LFQPLLCYKAKREIFTTSQRLVVLLINERNTNTKINFENQVSGDIFLNVISANLEFMCLYKPLSDSSMIRYLLTMEIE